MIAEQILEKSEAEKIAIRIEYSPFNEMTYLFKDGSAIVFSRTGVVIDRYEEYPHQRE